MDEPETFKIISNTVCQQLYSSQDGVCFKFNLLLALWLAAFSILNHQQMLEDGNWYSPTLLALRSREQG